MGLDFFRNQLVLKSMLVVMKTIIGQGCFLVPVEPAALRMSLKVLPSTSFQVSSLGSCMMLINSASGSLDLGLGSVRSTLER